LRFYLQIEDNNKEIWKEWGNQIFTFWRKRRTTICRICML